MKIKNLLLTLSFLILSSCIVKSLHPFYTKKSIFFEKRLLGNWQDTKKGTWKVVSFKEEVLKDNKEKDTSKLSDEDLIDYEKYKDAYLFNYVKDSSETQFFVMPFKIKKQLFLDFYPIDFEEGNLNKLVSYHLLKTHSLVKVEFTSEGLLKLRWFDEDKITDLIDNNRIKIKYEKVGIDENILLTASSEELQKFITKYIDSNDKDKWKTDVHFNLKKVDEKIK
ncbi:MAG: hypothetical protein QM486_12580 [Flavobacteriaceae bacterium]